MNEEMVLEEVVGGITVKYGGLVEFVNYNVEFNLFSLLRAVAFEPYLYESNVPKLDEELLSYLDEAKKEYPLYRYHLRDRERIMRIAYLIEKRRAGMKIYSEDIYGFGFWKPMRTFNEILAQSDGEEEYGYLVYEMNEEMVMLTTIERDVLNSALAGEKISLRKVHRYGSLIFPMYKELVASNHAWIYYSLDNVIERVRIRVALRGGECKGQLRTRAEGVSGRREAVHEPAERFDERAVSSLPVSGR